MSLPLESDIDLTAGTFEQALETVLLIRSTEKEEKIQLIELYEQLNHALAIIVKNIRNQHP